MVACFAVAASNGTVLLFEVSVVVSVPVVSVQLPRVCRCGGRGRSGSRIFGWRRSPDDIQHEDSAHTCNPDQSTYSCTANINTCMLRPLDKVRERPVPGLLRAPAEGCLAGLPAEAHEAGGACGAACTLSFFTKPAHSLTMVLQVVTVSSGWNPLRSRSGLIISRSQGLWKALQSHRPSKEEERSL